MNDQEFKGQISHNANLAEKRKFEGRTWQNENLETWALRRCDDDSGNWTKKLCDWQWNWVHVLYCIEVQIRINKIEFDVSVLINWTVKALPTADLCARFCYKCKNRSNAKYTSSADRPNLCNLIIVRRSGSVSLAGILSDLAGWAWHVKSLSRR